MTEHDDTVLEELVARALELEEDGEQVDLASLCSGHPELLPAVATALGRSAALADVHRASHDHDEWAQRELAGRYRLEHRLGAGAMGVVYRAFDVELQRAVAVKILRSELIDGSEAAARFDREAEVLAAVRHPAVVTVFDRGSTQDGLKFLVMELLEGVAVSDLLAEAKARAEAGARNDLDDTAWLRAHLGRDAVIDSSLLRQSVRWIAEIAEGLEAVHAAGVFHRDIKPSNVFIRRNGSAVLVDFGIAARAAEATIAERSNPIGTPAYLDPYQLEIGANPSPSPTTDVYGLSSTLYHMVTLRPPFEGTPHEVLAALQRREPPPASKLRPGLPRDLQAVLDCGMDRKPGRRYQTARAMGDDLRALLAFLPVAARPISGARRFARRLVRSRELRTGAMLTGLLAMAAAGVFWYSADAADRQTQWLQAWIRMPPALVDAPLRMRRIADDEARANVTRRLDTLVDLDVEPLPSHLYRAVYRLDNGEPRAAAADMRVVAELVGTDYARALAASYARLPDDAVDAAALELPPAPTDPAPLECYLLAFHQLRQAGIDPAQPLELLTLYEPEPPFVRDLQLRARMMAWVSSRRSRGAEVGRQILEDAVRIEGAYGQSTALTATAISFIYLDQARLEEAAAVLRDGLDLAPESHSLRINYANALRKLGDVMGAREQLEAAIRMRPNTFGARRTLMFTLLDIDDFAAAEALVDDTPFAAGDEGAGQRHWMRGEILLAQAKYSDLQGLQAARRSFAREALAEFTAGERLGDRSCESMLPTARAYAGEYDDLALVYLRRAAEAPLDWRRLGDLLATLPATLDGGQTAAVREYLLALRRALAPHLRDK